MDWLSPGENWLKPLPVNLGQSAKCDKLMVKIARSIVVKELSLSHLLSSKASMVSVGNFQSTEYE